MLENFECILDLVKVNRSCILIFFSNSVIFFVLGGSFLGCLEVQTVAWTEVLFQFRSFVFP